MYLSHYMTDHSVEMNEQLSMMIILELSLFNDAYLKHAYLRIVLI